MALLTRFIKLNDDGDSHVFTFLVTKSVTKSTINRDVVSKDFTYGFHRWAVSFSKENKVSFINQDSNELLTNLLLALQNHMNLQFFAMIYCNQILNNECIIANS